VLKRESKLHEALVLCYKAIENAEGITGSRIAERLAKLEAAP
jgi:hypothetical protein